MDAKICNDIISAKDIDPMTHDGSYRLVSEMVKEFKNVSEEKWDVADLDAIYLAAIGTWKVSYHVKIDRIWKTHLEQKQKNNLTKLVRSLHTEAQSHGNGHIGMFGTGFMSFKRNYTTQESLTDLRRFMRLLLRVAEWDSSDENGLLQQVCIEMEQPMRGINTAVLSELLHCLQPTVFPVINGAMGVGVEGYAQLGIEMQYPNNTKYYVENAYKVKTFRDENCRWKNYRVIDLYFIERRKYFQLQDKQQ